jgi:hypothetical protein
VYGHRLAPMTNAFLWILRGSAVSWAVRGERARRGGVRACRTRPHFGRVERTPGGCTPWSASSRPTQPGMHLHRHRPTGGRRKQQTHARNTHSRMHSAECWRRHREAWDTHERRRPDPWHASVPTDRRPQSIQQLGHLVHHTSVDFRDECSEALHREREQRSQAAK